MRIDPAAMTIDMKSITHGRNSVLVEVPLMDVNWNIEDVQPAAELGEMELVVEYSERSIVCTGMLYAVFQTPCARCLAPAEFSSSAGISMVYTSDVRVLNEGEAEPIIVQDDRLSILDAVRESIVLSIPLKPLCRPDCPGICYN